MSRIREFARHARRAWFPAAPGPLVILLLCIACATALRGAGPQLPAASASARPSSAAPAATSTPRPAAAAPDLADPVFDGTVLHEIHLTMAPDDWATLKARVLWNTYYPADFRWRDTTLANVAVRSRGSGSRFGPKPSLRIDFNRNVDQKFLTLSSIVLANAVQDPSMLRRRLAMQLFDRAGLPASRAAHARLFMNGQYVGLYELIEEPAKAMLARVFGVDASGKKRNNGYLLEYRWRDGYEWTYLGSDLAPYTELFEAQTRDTDPLVDIFGPIEGLMRAINETRDDEFEREVNRYLDLPQFVRYLAVDHFVSDHDGFLGAWGPNNFYVHWFPGEPAILFPWDRDLAFYAWRDDLYEGIDRTVLGRRTLAIPAMRRLYLDTLLACARRVAEVEDPGAGVPWLEAEYLRERDQIRDAARSDREKPYSNERVDEEHEEVLAFVRNRSSYVTGQVERELARMAGTGVR